MIFFIVLWAIILLALIVCGVALWRMRPITPEEPPTPPAHEFRRVHGHHYRMRLPDNMKLRIHDEER